MQQEVETHLQLTPKLVQLLNVVALGAVSLAAY